MTNDWTNISNTIIKNNMLLHVSTFKMSSSGSSLCLTKITYRFLGLDTGQARPQHQQSLHYAKILSRCKINILLKFIILYFKNFVLPRPRNLNVILVRRNEFPEDDILNVETCRNMLFIIIVFDITVQSLVKL